MTLKDEEREALIANYINKSLEAIEKVEFLIGHNELSLAVNRIYYGIYYILSALAVKYQCQNIILISDFQTYSINWLV